VKIVRVESLFNCGPYAGSADWIARRKEIHDAVEKCDWPPGTGKFTIFPGKHANGVVPIKKEFQIELQKRGWTIEGEAKNKLNQVLGDFDAIVIGKGGTVVAEWETGNISSSHRSVNKLLMQISDGVAAAGVLVVPSRSLYGYLTDRIGSITELEGYLHFWKKFPCESGVLEFIVIEQDAVSVDVPKIPKGSDGNAKKKMKKKKKKKKKS
jgi:hypothetical protein